MIKKFKKKPVVIEAYKFGGSSTDKTRIENWIKNGVLTNNNTITTSDIISFTIHTLEGNMVVSAGDWVIKGVAGEFYPCKPDIFKATYEEVN